MRLTAFDVGAWRVGDSPRLKDGAGRIDFLRDQMRNGLVHESMDSLVAFLYARRAAMEADAWRGYVADVLLRHPIRELLHRDPLTSRAFAKPQGYAGDATSIDMIYTMKYAAGVVDTIGDAAFRYNVDSPSARSIRNCRRRLAALIDETVRERSDARVLALGAGHLREIELMRTLGTAFVGEIVAVEQDEDALAVIEYAYAARGVRKLYVPTGRLLAGNHGLSGFDLVYAATMFNHLAQPSAATLCEQMFAMLNPGGRMLVANFVPDIADAGYLESYMAWQRIYRDEREMRTLIDGIPREQVADADLAFDGARNMIYLLVERQGAEELAESRQERLRERRIACRNELLRRITRRA